MRSRVRHGSVYSALQFPSDPIRTVRRQIRFTWLIGTSAIVMCALWAGFPLELWDQPDLTITLAQPSPQSIEQASESIDRSAFVARLWYTPAAQVGSEQSEPEVAKRPGSFRFQLIGIINDSGQLKAALYDADTDRLLIVTSGDRIRQHTVTAISAEGVELSDGRSTIRLALTEKPS